MASAPILLVQLQVQQACQKRQASTQVYVYPIPLETQLWGLWGFPLLYKYVCQWKNHMLRYYL